MTQESDVRAEIERRILENFNAIDLALPDYRWLKDKSYEEFSNAWNDLQRYYQKNKDTTISISVLDTYIEQVEILTAATQDQEIDIEQKRPVWAALSGLKIKMDKILQAVVDANPEDS